MSCGKTIGEKMTCDKYENPLLLAVAASDGELDAKLARHLERCSTCRSTLRLKRELFTRIDSALRTQMNEDPRPGFLPQLRLKLSKEPADRPGSNRAWHLAGAALALVLMAMFYPLVNARQSSIQENVQIRTITALPRVEVTQSARASENLKARSTHHSRQLLLTSAAQRAAPQQPEVLVPPDEQEAFVQFVARVAVRDVIAEAVVSPAAENPVAEYTDLPGVASVDMAALQFNATEQNQWMAETGESE
jgi:hypothetical protein